MSVSNGNIVRTLTLIMVDINEQSRPRFTRSRSDRMQPLMASWDPEMLKQLHLSDIVKNIEVNIDPLYQRLC